MQETEKIRVLIVDDSFFIRTYLTELLRADDAINIIGTAANGEEAVMLARKLHPDVITMDYNMPVMDGIEATAAIMLGDKPLPAIIMLSAFEGEEGKKVWKALSETGAHIIVKPSGEISLDIEKVARAIIDKVKEVGTAEVRMRQLFAKLAENGEEVPGISAAHKRSDGLRVLVIGASTGGPPLIEHLLTLFSPDEDIAVVIVQHMSAYFTHLFADHLNRVTGFAVREMENGDRLAPGVALVVPGGYQFTFRKNEKGPGQEPELLLTSEHDIHEEHAIDRAIEEISRSYGKHAAGILLSGMGKDGTEGLMALKRAGGLTIVQDPKDAPVASMPEHAVSEHAATEVLSIEEMPKAVRAHFTA